MRVVDGACPDIRRVGPHALPSTGREQGEAVIRPVSSKRSAAAAALVLCLLLLAGCARHTRPFTDGSGRTVRGSIASMEMIEIGGVRQSVWFRGRDTTALPLILLHGGPGASASALFRHYVPELENHFLVVYWEQRGTGRSHHREVTRESMTIARIEQDLDELVELVRSRFGHDRVVLLGHSWGTILGARYAHAHPEKLAAYAGIAQIADFERGKRVSLRWAVAQAEIRGNERALRELRAMESFPATVAEELALGRWVERFGGAMRGGLDTRRLIRAALGTDEANLVDLWKFGAGNRFSLRALHAEYSRVDLTELREFEVPIVFLLGRHDWHIPSVEAGRYYDEIEAPCKRLVWFENAAHNPPFEDPTAFVRAMIDVVLPLARDGCPT